MLLTITTTHTPATDLGFLLHKHPERVQTFDLSFGKAHVFYPEAAAERCTVALALDVDPVYLARGRRGPAGEAGLLDQYVNDRPYVASSFMSVAIAKVFNTALSGRSVSRQALADQALPFEARLAVLPCRGGQDFLRRLFEPLGYAVEAQRHSLDAAFPEWGDSCYYTVALRAACRLKDLLTHLYVLIPVLDDEKHYWVGGDELEKLLRHGEGWLAEHPERRRIVDRYLKHQSRLTRQALARLADEEAYGADPDAEALDEEAAVEEPVRQKDLRIAAVVAALRNSGARRVLDLGCGQGELCKALLHDRQFEEIVGMDTAHRALEVARERLRLDRLSARDQRRITLLHGSLLYRDARLAGFEAAAVAEVIEHLDCARLSAFERVVFEFARPGTVVITTPNADSNVLIERLVAERRLRRRDHRFEWTRAQFEAWARNVCARYGYGVRFQPVGPENPVFGALTQMGVFTRLPGVRVESS